MLHRSYSDADLRSSTLDPLDMLTLVHEYWHYHVDTTTTSGLLGMTSWLQIMGLVSSTLDASDPMEWFLGDSVMTETRRRELNLLLSRLRLVDGQEQPQPSLPSVEDGYLRYDRVSPHFQLVSVDGPTGRVEMPRIQVDIDIVPISVAGAGETTPTTLEVGAIAIDESAAAIIEAHLASSNAVDGYSYQSVPDFPYKFASGFGSAYNIRDRRDLVSLAICALNAPFPGHALAQLVEEARRTSVHTAVAVAQNRFTEEWGPIAVRYLGQFEEQTRRRGLLGTIMSRVLEQAHAAVSSRSENIVFDVDLFMSGDFGRLRDEVNRRPPLAVHYQTEDGSSRFASSALEDFEATMAWNAQNHFTAIHLSRAGVAATRSLDSIACPHVATCGVKSTGRFDTATCESRPWRHCGLGVEVCSYGLGMLQLIAEFDPGMTQRIEQRSDDPDNLDS